MEITTYQNGEVHVTFVYDLGNGLSWYTIQGSTIVSLVEETGIYDGVNLDSVQDLDVFNVHSPFYNYEDFEDSCIEFEEDCA